MATKLSIREKAENGALDDAYAEYIQAHSDRLIGNGDMLLGLMEEGHLFEEFVASQERHSGTPPVDQESFEDFVRRMEASQDFTEGDE